MRGPRLPLTEAISANVALLREKDLSDVTRSIEIFRAGRHRSVAGVDISFSEDEVAAIAGAYDPKKHEAPAVVGHPQLDGPAYGWVKGLAAEAGSLKAEVQLTPAFAEVVNAGHYKKVSAAFYAPDQAGNPEPGAYYLRHLGFLGAQPPAIKGLEGFQFADGVADGLVVIEVDTAFAEAEASDVTGLGRVVSRLLGIVERIRDHIAETDGAEQADKIADRRELDWMREDASELVGRVSERMRVDGPAHFSEPLKQPPEPNPEDTEVDPTKTDDKVIAEREANLAAREKRIAEQEQAAARADDLAFAESLVKAGQLPALQKDNLTAVLGALPRDAAAAIAFAEADDKGVLKTAQVSPHAAFKKMLAQAPNLVAFGEAGAGDGSVVIEDGGDLESAVEQINTLASKKVADAKAAGRTLAFAEAVAQVKKENRA